MKQKLPIRIAIIGYGYWGPNLVRNFHALDGAEIVYVCDARKERLAEVKRKYPTVDISKDFKEILNDVSVDAIVIATPISTHFPLAKQALRAGKHIWIEKPMTETSSQALELTAIAKAKKKILHIDHIFLYTEAVTYMKRVIVSGELGRVYYFDSTRINLGLFQPDSNVIWDLAPHDISIMCYLLDTIPQSVSAIATPHIILGLEDTADLNFRLGKMSAHIHLSWLSPVKIRRTIIAGSKKMIVYDDLETSEKIKMYDYGVSKNTHSTQSSTSMYQYRTGDIYSPALKNTEALITSCQAFLDSIITGKRSISSGQDGRRVVRILEASITSLRQKGRFVRI